MAVKNFKRIFIPISCSDRHLLYTLIAARNIIGIARKDHKSKSSFQRLYHCLIDGDDRNTPVVAVMLLQKQQQQNQRFE